MSDGYYLHRPDTVKQGYIGAGLLIGFLMASGARDFSRTLTGIAVGQLDFRGHRHRRGDLHFRSGSCPRERSQERARWKKCWASRNFSGRVEKDQIERLEKTPELFEKFLPYAMALQRGEKMGAGVFGNRLAAAAVVSGLLRERLHCFFSGE